MVAKTKKTTVKRKTPSRAKVSAKKKTASKRSAAKSGAVGKGKSKKTSASSATRRSSKATAKSAAKARLSPSSQDPIQFPEEHRRLPKTYLSAKELRAFREILLTKRTELCGDVQHLTDEALNKSGGACGERSSMPIHMADLGSDTWEKEFTLGLIANEQARVREIDAALERIEKRTYGVCLATHNKIEIARLRAKPWAKYCIEYARAREEGRAV